MASASTGADKAASRRRARNGVGGVHGNLPTTDMKETITRPRFRPKNRRAQGTNKAPSIPAGANLTNANRTGVTGWDTVKGKDAIVGLDTAINVPD